MNIVVTTCNNIEWVSAFLLAMRKTLCDLQSKIVFVDGSSLLLHKDLLYSEKYGLNVQIIHSESSSIQARLEGIDLFPDNSMVCSLDVDTIMLRKGWDAFVQSKENKGFTLIGNSSRYHDVIEPNFCVARKELLIESQFGSQNYIEKTVGWNNAICPVTSNPETAALTYLNAMHTGKTYWIDGCLLLPSTKRYSHIVVDGDANEEFLYHNFYSAKCKKDLEIRDYDFFKYKELISSASHNSLLLLYYMKNVWPLPLIHFFTYFNFLD